MFIRHFACSRPQFASSYSVPTATMSDRGFVYAIYDVLVGLSELVGVNGHDNVQSLMLQYLIGDLTC
jgi:hypothetical protein